MNSRQSHIIKRPIINEKTVTLTQLGQYTFEVAKDATKTEIAEALEQILSELYPKNNNTVMKVRTAPIRERFRRSKRHGRQPVDGKKAIVTLSGEPLEIFGG